MEDDDASQMTQSTQIVTQADKSHCKRLVDYSKSERSDMACLLVPLSDPTIRVMARAMLRTPQHVLQNDDLAGVKVGDFHPKSRYMFPKRDLCLRLSSKCLHPEQGWIFGRGYEECDIGMATTAEDYPISGQHFRIYYHPNGTLMLEDLSSNGTQLDNEHITAASESRTQILKQGSTITVHGADKKEISFMVSIPNREDHILEWRSRCRQWLLERGQEPSFHILDGHHLGNHWNGFPTYGFKRTLGSGTFASVYLVQNNFTGNYYAAKELKNEIVTKRGLTELNTLNEVRIMQSLDHPHIVKFHTAVFIKRCTYLMMEAVEYGTMTQYIRDGCLLEGEAKSVMRQLLTVIDYCHGRGVIHRDIKPDNLLVYSQSPLIIKLADFGLSRKLSQVADIAQSFCGTMAYCAPEIFPSHNMHVTGTVTTNKDLLDLMKTQPYTPAVDWWSAGAVLYFLMSRKYPINCSEYGIDHHAVCNNVMTLSVDYNRLRRMKISEDGITVLRNLMVLEPHLRWGKTKCLQHDWLRHTPDVCDYTTVMLTRSRFTPAHHINQHSENFYGMTEPPRYNSELIDPQPAGWGLTKLPKDHIGDDGEDWDFTKVTHLPPDEQYDKRPWKLGVTVWTTGYQPPVPPKHNSTASKRDLERDDSDDREPKRIAPNNIKSKALGALHRADSPGPSRLFGEIPQVALRSSGLFGKTNESLDEIPLVGEMQEVQATQEEDFAGTEAATSPRQTDQVASPDANVRRTRRQMVMVANSHGHASLRLASMSQHSSDVELGEELRDNDQYQPQAQPQSQSENELGISDTAPRPERPTNKPEEFQIVQHLMDRLSPPPRQGDSFDTAQSSASLQSTSSIESDGAPPSAQPVQDDDTDCSNRQPQLNQLHRSLDERQSPIIRSLPQPIAPLSPSTGSASDQQASQPAALRTMQSEQIDIGRDNDMVEQPQRQQVDAVDLQSSPVQTPPTALSIAATVPKRYVDINMLQSEEVFDAIQRRRQTGRVANDARDSEVDSSAQGSARSVSRTTFTRATPALHRPGIPMSARDMPPTLSNQNMQKLLRQEPPKVVIRFHPEARSLSSSIVDVSDHSALIGRASDCTIQKFVAQACLPRRGIKVYFAAPGLERALAKGANWRKVPGLQVMIATSARKGIRVNGVQLMRESPAFDCTYFGYLYNGDVVTLKDDGPGRSSMIYRVEIVLGKTAGKRPRDMQTFQALSDCANYEQMRKDAGIVDIPGQPRQSLWANEKK